MAYSILFGLYGEEKPDPEPYFLAMDGDPMRIEVVDPTPDGGGLIVGGNCGRPIKPDFVPTAVERGGPSLGSVPMLDVNNVYGMPMVTQAFKDILEELEPGVHQFFPMAVYWKGEKIADNYWLNVCTRLDVYHPELTYPRNERGFYKPVKDGSNSMVYSEDRIGNHHVWVGKYTNRIAMSNTFAERLKSAGLTGMKFNEVKEA